MIDIRSEYAYHQPTPEQLAVMDALRRAYSNLATILDSNVINCRQKSLAITKLEESAFWCNKAIVLGQPNGNPTKS